MIPRLVLAAALACAVAVSVVAGVAGLMSEVRGSAESAKGVRK